MNCPKCSNELRYSKIDSACYLCHQCHEAYPVTAIERIAELEAQNAVYCEVNLAMRKKLAQYEREACVVPVTNTKPLTESQVLDHLALIHSKIAELKSSLREFDKYRGKLLEQDALCERIEQLEAKNAQYEKEIAKLRSLLELAKEIMGEEWTLGYDNCQRCPACYDSQKYGHVSSCKRGKFFKGLEEMKWTKK